MAYKGFVGIDTAELVSSGPQGGDVNQSATFAKGVVTLDEQVARDGAEGRLDSRGAYPTGYAEHIEKGLLELIVRIINHGYPLQGPATLRANPRDRV